MVSPQGGSDSVADGAATMEAEDALMDDSEIEGQSDDASVRQSADQLADQSAGQGASTASSVTRSQAGRGEAAR